ncbi:MAG: c-type cytochrome [Gemmatimonadales bacterium]
MRELWLAALALGLISTASVAQERLERSGPRPDAADLNEDWQRASLPQLPKGLTLDMIRQGDQVYRGKGACDTCHGPDGGGMPASGSGITAGLNFVPSEWGPIDSLIRVGIAEPLTRTPIAMPPRGAQSNLTDEESRQVAAYVWAISQVRGEPWPGGHETHEPAPQE